MPSPILPDHLAAQQQAKAQTNALVFNLASSIYKELIVGQVAMQSRMAADDEYGLHNERPGEIAIDCDSPAGMAIDAARRFIVVWNQKQTQQERQSA